MGNDDHIACSQLNSVNIAGQPHPTHSAADEMKPNMLTLGRNFDAKSTRQLGPKIDFTLQPEHRK